ncbi:MAG: hypothetical protein HC889_12600, partial [Synechococcaceae cyanobacterium SM1_2_3]|nr:hypothetical protein [Synechococcaceae cyanobacterium SM1_2_3]
MTTLLDVRNRVADQLARSDLSTQIDREIQLAIQRYNRQVTWLHEVRMATLTGVPAQTWYDTISLATGDRPARCDGPHVSQHSGRAEGGLL